MESYLLFLVWPKFGSTYSSPLIFTAPVSAITQSDSYFQSYCSHSQRIGVKTLYLSLSRQNRSLIQNTVYIPPFKTTEGFPVILPNAILLTPPTFRWFKAATINYSISLTWYRVIHYSHAIITAVQEFYNNVSKAVTKTEVSKMIFRWVLNEQFEEKMTSLLQ